MPGGFVYLVGAGPGDPALLTLRGRDVLARAESVIYDSLVHPDILSWAPPQAERLRMGKVGHAHQFPQEEITRALVERAEDGKVVVRLKGGDPCVFGRVGEEALALAERGIAFEIVPGVTAASGASAYSGIPLTHRSFAPSATVVTGHRSGDWGDGPEIDWEALARASGTIVVYMGGKRLTETAQVLMGAGRTPSTPVAVVCRATWPDQTVVTGTLGDIAARVQAAGLKPPAIVIVGEVVSLQDKLDWFGPKPLRGKRILVTRAEHQAEELSRLLRERWAQPVVLPLIKLRACGHRSAVDGALRRLFAYDWVIFSSGNAVEFTFRRLEQLGLDARSFGAARVCAVGPKTAAALSVRGIRADVIPEAYLAESLVEAMTAEAQLQGASVLLPRAKEARELIPEELGARGARVEVLPIYENVRPESHPEAALRAWREGGLDLVTLASSSAARNYVKLCEASGVQRKRYPCAVIGPATRKTATDLGLHVAVMPDRYLLEDLVTAVEDYFRRAH